jgi:hypothetical protein
MPHIVVYLANPHEYATRQEKWWGLSNNMLKKYGVIVDDNHVGYVERSQSFFSFIERGEHTIQVEFEGLKSKKISFLVSGDDTKFLIKKNYTLEGKKAFLFGIYKLMHAFTPWKWMTLEQNQRLIVVDRDSVCAGDDMQSHTAACPVPPDATIAELLEVAIKACQLPIENRPWIVAIAGMHIGVFINTWGPHSFIIPIETKAEQLFNNNQRYIDFKGFRNPASNMVFDAFQMGEKTLLDVLATERDINNKFEDLLIGMTDENSHASVNTIALVGREIG